MNLFDLNKFDFYYVVFVLFVIGACLGSFLNVVILRAFTEESIVLPPSKCPKCHNKLKWYHNIPILSYIFLRGKCGFCHEKISIQYPIVEFFFAVFFTAIFLKFGLTVNAFFLMVAAALSLVMTVCDIKEQVIFDVHAYILAVVGLIYNFFNIGQMQQGAYDFTLFAHNFSINKSFVSSLLGILLAVAVIEGIVLVFRLILHQRAFGDGDSFILGSLGAVFGVHWVVPIFFFGLILQVVAYLPMLVKKMLHEKDYAQIVSLGLFIIAVVLHLYSTSPAVALLPLWATFAFLLVSGVAAIITSLISVKKAMNEDGPGLTSIPFGPPLIVAAWILLFIGFKPWSIMLLSVG